MANLRTRWRHVDAKDDGLLNAAEQAHLDYGFKSQQYIEACRARHSYDDRVRQPLADRLWRRFA